MNWNLEMNQIISMIKAGKFHEAFATCETILTNQITEDQKAYLYFEMGMCKAELTEYEIAEDYVVKSLDIKETEYARNLLKTLYELNPSIPKELKYLKELSESYKESDMLTYKLIVLYHQYKCYYDMINLTISNKITESGYLCSLLSSAYLKLLDAKSAVKIYDRFIKLIEHNQSTDLEYVRAIEVIRTTLFMSAYDEIYNDDEYLKMTHFLYSNTLHHTHNITIDTSFFRKLKIGILSSDIKKHPVGLFLISLFMEQNKNDSITYTVYDTSGASDSITEFIKNNVNEFHNVKNFTDEALEEFILNDHLDILLELNSLSENNKLSIIKNRLAPIQISWIGFPTTSALPNIDYVILDKITAVNGFEDNYYTEKIIRMNHTSLCYALDTKIIKTEPSFVKNGYITFASFSNALKLSTHTLNCWSKILKRIPSSKLFLMTLALNEEFSKEALLKKFLEADIALERVILHPYTVYQTYLEKYNEVDIILDTYPFNGGTTTAEALTFGIPIISQYGKHHVSRVGFSMLTNVGFSDLAVDTAEAYIEKAVSLATNKEKLYSIHQTLREKTKKSTLCNYKLFQTEFENRLRSVYIDYCIENKTNATHAHDNAFEEIKTAIQFLENLNEEYKTKEEYTIYMQKLQAISKELMDLFILDAKTRHIDSETRQQENLYNFTEYEIGISKLTNRMSKKKLLELLNYLVKNYQE